MKIIKKIKNSQRKRTLFAVVAVIGFFGMLGGAGGLDLGRSTYSSMMIIVAAFGSFIIGFIGMKHYDNEIIMLQKRLIGAKRHSAAANTPRNTQRKAAGDVYCDIA